MKHRIMILILALVIVGGCNGVQLNPEYSQQLDTTVALSGVSARQAQINTDAALAGDLSNEEILEALVWSNEVLNLQAQTWVKFQQGRDGVSE